MYSAMIIIITTLSILLPPLAATQGPFIIQVCYKKCYVVYDDKNVKVLREYKTKPIEVPKTTSK